MNCALTARELATHRHELTHACHELQFGNCIKDNFPIMEHFNASSRSVSSNSRGIASIHAA